MCPFVSLLFHSDAMQPSYAGRLASLSTGFHGKKSHLGEQYAHIRCRFRWLTMLTTQLAFAFLQSVRILLVYLVVTPGKSHEPGEFCARSSFCP